MNFKKVDVSDKADLEFVEKVYIESFPPNERRPVLEFRLLIQNKEDFTVYLFLDSDIRIGFLTCWLLDSFVFVDHFAIASEFRSGGYGKDVLASLIEQTSLPIVLEVELPDTDLAKRRITFYQRAGFRLWDIPYEQLPYEEKYQPVPMLLMTYGSINLDENFEEVKSLIYRKVYNAPDKSDLV